MAQELVLSVKEAMVTFGGKPLFENLSFNLHQGDKICLVGKNGAGKSTLMQIITGDRELDGGERELHVIGTSIGYLKQEVKPKKGQTVFDYIYSGLDEERRNDEYAYLVDMVMEPLELNPKDQMVNLSGGQLRRASLARSLVEDPDILLLDEPTNHLDLKGIQWLEDYLRGYRGTLLCISHDKTFLANITNKIFWLDRGIIRSCPRGFAHFDEWSTMLLEQEERELAKRSKIVEQEMEWANRGVKARVKRNVRRMEQARAARDKLKADKSLYRQSVHKVKLPELKPADSSRIIAEFYNVSKEYKRIEEDGSETKKVILDDFSFRVMRGDRIGILGQNGSGKTSFLKMLIGETQADTGTIKLGKNLEVSYFDQKRSDLNPEDTLWETLCDSGDYVDVAGKPRHVCGYLKDFLFDPKTARDRVGTLSGGQRNRLLLAKVLANPGSFLILDEPTNDLDMDTLEMLEEILAHYKGTLFIVSHDRDFLDQTVTQILAFEGDGIVERCIGGYSDYIEFKNEKISQENSFKSNNNKENIKQKINNDEKEGAKKKPVKLTYKLQYELDNLPDKIAKLEDEISELSKLLSDPDFYSKDFAGFDKSSRRISIAQKELEQLENRWLELEEMKLEN